MSFGRTGAALTVALLCGALVDPLTARAIQGHSDSLVVDDPRPLAAAVLELEQRCHCVITYEDWKWTQSEVEEVTNVPARSPGGLRPKVPKGKPLSVTLDRQIDATAPDEMQAAFHAVFDAFERAGNPGAFRVVSSQTGYHVVPKDQALFDVRITVAPRSRSVADAIPELLAAAGTASDSRILLGRVPLKLLMGTNTDAGANDERLGDVLARIHLNLHTVQ